MTAARAAGLSLRTLRRWLARGRDEESGPYRDLLTQVEQAEHEAEVSMVAVVRTAAVDDAKHAEWWLERKFPERWSRDRDVLKQLKLKLHELEAMLNAALPAPAQAADAGS